ncbi:phage holin family protein [Lacrimispora sp.]|uniref:phage holin family protein n=1 Tax=Lacrimispora sp. TaxID=2719234 RepID=UPI002F3F1CFA
MASRPFCRKCMTLLFVLIAFRLDLAIWTNYIRDMVIIGFMANELISIVENAGLMGLPLPAVLIKAFYMVVGQEVAYINKKGRPAGRSFLIYKLSPFFVRLMLLLQNIIYTFFYNKKAGNPYIYKEFQLLNSSRGRGARTLIYSRKRYK